MKKPTSSMRGWLILAACHAAAALLFGSWYLSQDIIIEEDGDKLVRYPEAASPAFWKNVDYAVFKSLNGSLKDNRPAQTFWALTNHRKFDLVQGAFIALLYAVFLFKGTPEEKLHRIKAGLYMGICIVLAMQAFHFTAFNFDRRSPTILPVEGAIRLSKLEHITWDLKDASKQSFPGDHSSVLFLVTVFISYYAGRKYGFCAAILAVLGILPRLVGGAHWLTDVIVGGGTIALITGAWALCSPLQRAGLKLLHWPALLIMRAAGKLVPALAPPKNTAP